MSFESELATILQTTEKNALPRARGLRVLPVCGRCGGSGQYSFNQINGTTCFGCNGSGQVAPKSEAQKKLTLEEAEYAIQQGKLEPYLARLAAQARIKKGTDLLMKMWTDSGIGKAYDWRKASNGTPREGDGYVNPDFCQRDKDISEINKKMADAYSAFTDLSFKLPKPTADNYQEKVLELDAVLEKSKQAIADANAELQNYMKG